MNVDAVGTEVMVPAGEKETAFVGVNSATLVTIRLVDKEERVHYIEMEPQEAVQVSSMLATMAQMATSLQRSVDQARAFQAAQEAGLTPEVMAQLRQPPAGDNEKEREVKAFRTGFSAN